jgi:hypothetical protein
MASIKKVSRVMNIALPLLLLIFGSLSFWLMTDSSLKWYIKTACISTFCVFTIIFWSTIHSFLGWPADEDDIPEIVRVHWVVIKEPNKHTEYEGAIYFLLESAQEETSTLRKFFGYKGTDKEPRLYGLPYSREMHERLAREMIPKLKRGLPVVGRLTQGKGKGKKRRGEQKSKDGGSESQDQEWHFHELRPSDFLNKPTD